MAFPSPASSPVTRSTNTDTCDLLEPSDFDALLTVDAGETAMTISNTSSKTTETPSVAADSWTTAEGPISPDKPEDSAACKASQEMMPVANPSNKPP